MSLGLNQKFNILQQSPHDVEPPSAADLEESPARIKWVPSRYNIRATTEDGRLVLWNTFRGSMSVFKAHQVERIVPLLSRKGFEAAPDGIVKYLADRGFLIKAGENEYRQVEVAINQQQFRTDRLEFILLASEDCNFRCKYCYEEFARGTMRPEVRTGIKNLVKSRLKRLSFLSVSWFGGEPLYGFPAIEDLAPFFLQAAEDNDLGYSFGMTTNGYLLTPEIADKLLAWKIRNYQITLDGVAEDHDRSRPARDGRGTFAQIHDNLVSLSQRPDEFRVSIRINFDRENHPRLSELVEQLEENFSGDPRFSLNFFAVGRWGGTRDADLNVCGTDEAEQVRTQLKAEARRRGLGIGTIKGINYLGGEVCYAARPYNLIVGATGKIMKCTIALDTKDYNVVGSLQEDGALQLDSDKMALWTEPAFENDTQCQKCVVLPVCQGTHCPLVRIVEHKSPCSAVRSAPKQALLEAFENRGETSRQAIVANGTRYDPITHT
jgi:uncharacterized protein